MTMLKTWKNGEKASSTKDIIEYNFKLLGRYLSNNIIAAPRDVINSLSSDYLSDELIAFDTTNNVWLRYRSGVWQEDVAAGGSAYSQSIRVADWQNNEIVIAKSVHGRRNPIVELYILNGKTYEAVLGGVFVDSGYNITLRSDVPFDGKVVIK